MKKKDLYKIVKQSLKEVLQEQGPDKSGGNNNFLTQKEPQRDPVDPNTGLIGTTDLLPADLTPNLEPANVIPPQITGCDPAGYPDYGDFTATLLGTENFGFPGNGTNTPCQFPTVDDSYICCSSNNLDHNEITGFNIQTAYDGGGTLQGYMQTNFTYDGTLGCYCPNPTTISDGSGGVLITSCDINMGGTAGQNNYLDFAAWASVEVGAGWNLGNSSTVNPGTGLTANWPDLSPNCPGCTYSLANNYDSIYNAEDGSCEFTNKCNAEFFDNYFCDDQNTYAGVSTVDPGQNLCPAGTPNIIATPAAGLVGVAEVLDDDECEFEGCFDANQATGPSGYGLPNTNYVCNGPYASVMCDAGAQATSYTDNNGASQTPTITNSGCVGTPVVIGCTDSDFATNIGGNYNASANVNDGIGGYTTQECSFTGCLDELSISGLANSNWVCSLEPDLCVNGANPGSLPDPSKGNFFPGVDPITGNSVCTTNIVFGCTDNTFAEYSSLYSWDNVTYTTEALSNNNYCNTQIISGCTEPTNVDGNSANNYFCDDPAATGTYACTGTGTNVLPTINVTLPVQGTIAVTLVINDGSCDYDLDDDGFDDDEEVVGCGDPTATNYDPAATDPGVAGAFTAADFVAQACTYEILGCTDPNATFTTTTTDPNTTIIEDGSCIFAGCTQPLSSNQTQISSTATLPNGTNPYDGKKLISTVSVGTTVGSTITGTDDGSCEFLLCTTSSAANYLCDAYPALCTGYTGPGTGTPNGTPFVATNPPGLGLFTDTGCLAESRPGCTDDTPGIPGHPYHDNPDTQGNGSYLATNYDPVATLGNADDICGYNFCSDLDAYNYSGTDPRGDQWSIAFSNGTTDVCEYEGCVNDSANTYINHPTDDPQVEYPGWSVYSSTPLYYASSQNAGCQNNPGNPGTADGMLPTGDLDPQDDSCCMVGGCTDNGQWGVPLGQQLWNALNYPSQPGYPSTYPNDMVGLPPTNTNSYPSNGMVSPVVASNYDPNTTVDTGNCQYNFGCTISDAPNYDPNATVENNTCLEPCKKVTAKQCNPDPYPWNEQDYTITIDCAHMGSNTTPQVGDQFWHDNGRIFAPPPITTSGPPCKDGCDGTHNVPTYPFPMAGNFDGEIRTWNCCRYKWFMGGSCWQLHPPNSLQFQCGRKEAQKEDPTQIVRAVFEIVNINPDQQKPVKILPPWSCEDMPPPKGDQQYPVGPTLGEVKLSRKLRKALKFQLLSEEEKLKTIIKRILKKQ